MGQKPHTLLSAGNTAQICILMTLARFCLWLDQNPFSLPEFEGCPAFSLLHKSTYTTPCLQGKCWQGILNLSAFLFCLLNCFCRLFRCFKLNLTAKICSQQYPDVTWTNHFLLCVSSGITDCSTAQMLLFHVTVFFISTCFLNRGSKTIYANRIKLFFFISCQTTTFYGTCCHGLVQGGNHAHLTSFPHSSVSTSFHFPVRFQCFPFQQAQTLSIQEECISEETSNENSSLQILSLARGRKITFLRVEKIGEKKQKEKQTNYCHLELIKRTFSV